jgi:uncharacterized protein (DUF4415 family)
MSRKATSLKSAAEAEAERLAAFEGEAPALDREFFEGAQLRVGRRIIRPADGTLTRRGRPPVGERAKVQQSLRLSPEVIEHFRATGPGWQARIDEVLRRHVAERSRGANAGRVAETKVAEEQAEYRTGGEKKEARR